MCGIAGAMWFAPVDADVARGVVEKMVRALRHRGPDGEGLWVGGRAEGPTVALGHTRLAIIDLSDGGRQPMSAGGDVVTCNGEIYNFRALRAELETHGHRFRSASDTEVVLHAHARWPDAFVDRLDGMFALGLYDSARHRLTLARDRLGIKPLYYAHDDAVLVFASEVRALLASGLAPARLDPEGLWHYLGHQTAPTPSTLIDGVRMLEPGQVLTVDRSGTAARRVYWDLADALEPSGDQESASDVRKRIGGLLSDSVRAHLVSDVPVGVFLSGGIDSSALVSAIAAHGVPVRTFSVTFRESSFDESAHARAVAEAFRTDHTELDLTAGELLEMMPEILEAVDHPSGDGVNAYVVSRAVRAAGITVALSGLGGDEVFGGYPSFQRLARLVPMTAAWRRAPERMRRAAAGVVRGLGSQSVATAKAAAAVESDGLLSSLWPVTRQLFDAAARRQLLGPEWWPNSARAQTYRALLADVFARQPDAGLWASVSYAEARTYMHDVLLRDTDQMSMAHGLEVRVPLLDHRLVSAVLRAGDAVKQDGHSPKALLVESLPMRLPASVVDRPKRGFTLPFDVWMRSSLRELCAQHLGDQGLEGRGLFRPGAVRSLWQKFLDGSRDVTWARIWMLVALDAWLDRAGVAGEQRP